MDKLLTFSGYDQAGPHIFPIEADRDRTIGHIKMARPLPPRVEHYIKTAKAIPGKTQLLIDALGAGEYWGSNVNGDYFPESALRHDGDDFGHRTFEKFAFPFKHHVNKDPAKAFGEKVTLSEYDPNMHRVILVVQVHDHKCQDILGDLAQGKYWDVSMGCRVPWDECSICKNRGKNRGEYCDHLKYQMNKILPDGRRVCAYNWLPKFFDISFVLIGAEKASHVLKKVAYAAPAPMRSSAELGERYYKLAVQKKEADIDKQVPSNLPASESKITPLDQVEKKNLVDLTNAAGSVKSQERPISNKALDQLSGFSWSEIASTLAALGIPLKPEELQRIVLVKTGQINLANKMDAVGMVFDEYKTASVTPAWVKQLEHFDASAVSEKVAGILRPYIAERCCYPEALAARLSRMEKHGSEMIYNKKWYPVLNDDNGKSSGSSGFVPVGLTLAAALILLKRQLPKAMGEGAMGLLAKYPWLIPILVAGGVGASTGLSTLLAPRTLSDSHTLGSVDAMGSGRYDATKTASLRGSIATLGLIPAAYIYSGIQRRRAENGEQLGTLDQAIAERPDLAAVAAFVGGPPIGQGMRKLFLKHGSVLSDVGSYAIASPSKFVPGLLAGALLDSAIFQGIARLAKKETRHADAR